MNATTYRMTDLQTVKSYFRGDPRFGRTTKLVDRRTGETMIEVMGIATKGQAHIAYLNEMCRQAAESTR